MKIRLLALCLLTTTTVLWAQTPTPETSSFTGRETQFILEQARKWYETGDPESLKKMDQSLAELLQRAPKGEINSDAVKLARGIVLLKNGDPEGAMNILEEIEGFEQPSSRAQMRQMKGNAQMQLAEKAVSAEDWQNAKTQMQAAIDSFSNALREDGTLDAAQYNLELAAKRLEEIKAQEPPPPPEQDKQDNKEEDNKEEEKNEEQEKQNQPDKSDDQQQQNQDQPDQSDQPDEEKQPDQSDQSDEEKQPDQSDQSDQPDDQQQPTQSDPSDQSADGEPTEAEKLDARQAQQILEAALEQEKHQRRQIQLQRIKPVPVEKDW